MNWGCQKKVKKKWHTTKFNIRSVCSNQFGTMGKKKCVFFSGRVMRGKYK